MKVYAQLIGSRFDEGIRSVDWEFLYDIMLAMDFPNMFIHRNRQCIYTARFSIVKKAEIKGYLHGERVLRQGDPISPCLFLLVMLDLFSCAL